MGEKIIVGPINKGFKNDRTAFVIDNDSFPTLINAYQWRGRVKRKRGTSFLGRLTRNFNSLSPSSNPNAFLTVPTTSTSITNDGSGNGNILNGNGAGTGFNIQQLSPNASIVPSSVTITFPGPIVVTDLNGQLFVGAGLVGTINYSSGAVNFPAAAGATFTAIFNYYPNLPVMGLEELILGVNAFSGTLGFDTKYSYNITTTTPSNIYDVSFYKNIGTGTSGYPGYTQKTNWTPTTWNGQDYQQFWTVNYQGALWATNGINVPFDPTNVGMQFSTITGVAIVSGGPPAIITINVASSPAVIGDFVFINEIVGMTGINWQTGYVVSVVAGVSINVEFPNATIAGAWASGGIVQYLTNRSDVTKDCLRWYDGDPTNGNSVTPGFTTGKGWVNFAPPLSQDNFSIADLPAAKYYLVGARMIYPFKDRLLFIGPVVQTSSPNSQVYLQDTVIFSQNGTPYYTASYSNNPVTVPPSDNPTSPLINFHELLVPVNQTATANAYFEDSTGFGGYLSAGLDDPIITVSSNEDVLLMGFNKSQSRFVYTGNDILPFNFFTINTEMGSSSTFSVINMDQGSLSKGDRGYVITSQTQVQRIDLDIPDQVFEVSLTTNGNERVCAQRDFIKEWVYFTYPTNQEIYKFPDQTLQYNYRDNSFGIFNECYTTYGSFRKSTGQTWATLPSDLTWSTWNEPWNSGSSTLLQPLVIGGNQQGFIVFRDQDTGESNSLYIQNIAANIVTSPDHTLNEGDFIIISGALGTIGTAVNNKIFSVDAPITTNSFSLNPIVGAGTYIGGGLIKRMYIPQIQTKQFPTAWGIGRKTRLGPQQYLLTKTSNAQITLLIFLSQDGSNPFNDGAIYPDLNSANDSLIYSTVLYTCPESTNLGLTAANTNLQMVTAGTQAQIWHRMNTSLLGDTVQVGFTLSDDQMRAVDVNGNPVSQFAEIELHGIILDVNPSMVLA